jgi:serine/threonine protein kinase
LESVRAFLAQAKQQAEAGSLPRLDGLTHSGKVMGSPNYMAPEQAAGDLKKIGPHTDTYALGGILYELVTGQPPFQSKDIPRLLMQILSVRPVPPRQLQPKISRDLEAICMQCLEKSPDRRYPSALALAEDLTRFLEGYSPSAVAASPSTIAGVTEGAVSETYPMQHPGEDNASLPRATTRSWWPFGRKKPK